MTNESKTAQSRRDFLKGAALVSTGVALGPVLGNAASDGGEKIAPAQHQTMLDYAAPPIPTVRIGLIGTGARGVTHLRLLAGIPGVSIKAICDTDPISLENAKAAVKKTGIPEPSYHTGNKHAYREMLDGDAIDAVVISTPWRWHAPMCIDAMNAGKHAFVEVPMATTIEDLWEMVEVSERTRMHCMMMENVCYGRDEMMVLNLVRQGLFGELTHGEGAYIHDLRWQMKEIERGTGSWRTHYHTTQRGNIYPTHGLGPIAQYMNINRGDRFDFMTSLSSPALGRSAYAGREFPPGHQRNALKYVKGDMNSTIIKTVKGRSILVQYDTTTARPYNRLNLVQGTNGTFAGFPNRIALESPPKNIHQLYEAEHAQALNEWENGGQHGDQPRIQSFHRWDMDMNKWRMHYDHPFWKKMAAVAEQAGGHGGMDFVMLWRMVQCLQNGLALDQNVYDGAAWSSVFPLSHASVVSRSKSMDFPDFTRGRWKTAKSLDIAA